MSILKKMIEEAIVNTLTEEDQPEKINIMSKAIGQYVIVRSRSEGINAGFVEAADETGIVLLEARRIWYHKPKDTSFSWYEGVAISGLSKDSKISAPLDYKVIVEDYSITPCKPTAIESIRQFKAHEQN